MSGPSRTQRPHLHLVNQQYPSNAGLTSSTTLPSLSSSLSQLYSLPGIEDVWSQASMSTLSTVSSTSMTQTSLDGTKQKGLCSAGCPPHVLVHSDCKAAAGLRGLFTSLLDPLLPSIDVASSVEEKWTFKSSDGTSMNGIWHRTCGGSFIMAVTSTLVDACNLETCPECNGKRQKCQAIVLSAYDKDSVRMKDVDQWPITYQPDPDGSVGGDRAFRVLQAFLDNPLSSSVAQGGTRVQVYQSVIEDRFRKRHSERLSVLMDDWRDVDTSKGLSPSLWRAAGRKWFVSDSRGCPILVIDHHPSQRITVTLTYRTGRWGVARASRDVVGEDVRQELAALHFACLLLLSKQVPLN